MSPIEYLWDCSRLTTDGACGLECVEVIEGEAAISGHRGSSGRKSLMFVAEPKASGLGKIINESTWSGRARASQRRARFCPTSKMSHVRQTHARLFRTTAHVERRTAGRNRRASQHVGSGALLGGSDKCRTRMMERTRLRKNTVRGIERVATPPRAGTRIEALGMRQNSPGHLIRRLHPIRAFEEPSVSSGEGAINSQASHARPACLIFFGSYL